MNFLICCWDGFVSGIIWEQSQSLVEKVLAVSAFIMGYVGFAYTLILVGVVVGYLPDTLLIATNVVLGLPIIVTGVIITIHSWIQAMRSKSMWSFGISIWNTFAIVHDIGVWMRSVRMLREMGGLKTIFDFGDDSSTKVKVGIFAVLSVFISTLIIYGLHRAGRNYAIEHTG